MHKNVKGMNISMVNSAYFENFELYRIFIFYVAYNITNFSFTCSQDTSSTIHLDSFATYRMTFEVCK
jgi:hypothetical protein